MSFEVYYTKARPVDEQRKEILADRTITIAEQLANTYTQIKELGGTVVASHVMSVEHFPQPMDVWFTVADMPDAAPPAQQ